MNDLTTLGRWIILAGMGVLILGAFVWLAGKIGLPLGQLPGDIRVDRGGFSCFMPLATSLLLSLLLTLLLNLILQRMR